MTTMINYCESMSGLKVSCGRENYTTTGYRYFDRENFAYWYQAVGDIWLLGTAMQYQDGRIR